MQLPYLVDRVDIKSGLRISHIVSFAVKCICNNIHSLLLVKVPNRIRRNLQDRRNLLQNVSIDLFPLFEQGNFLLVPVVA
jgi:hypothetical protein